MFGGNFKLDGNLGQAATTAQKGYQTHQLNQNLQSGNYKDAAQNAHQVYQLEQQQPSPNGGLATAAQAYAYDQYAPQDSYQAAGSLHSDLHAGDYGNAAHHAQSLYHDADDYYQYPQDSYSQPDAQADLALDSKPKNIGWSDVGNFAGNLAGKQTPPPAPKNDLASLAGNFFGGQQQPAPQPQQQGFGDALGNLFGGQQQPAPQPQSQGFGGAIGSFLGGQQQPAPQQQGFGGALGNLFGGQQQQPQQDSGLGAVAGLFGQQQQPQQQGWGAAANLFGGQGGSTQNNAATGADALNTISALAGGSQNLPKDVQNTQASLNFYNNYNQGNYLEAGKHGYTLWENHQAGGDGANTNPITQLSNQWKSAASGQGATGLINPLLSRLGGFGTKAQPASEQLAIGGPKNIASSRAGVQTRANVQADAPPADQYYDYSIPQANQQDQYNSYDQPQQSNNDGYYYADDQNYPQTNSSHQTHSGDQQYSQPDYYSYDTPATSQSNQSYYRNEQPPANNQNYYDNSSYRS